MKRRLLLSYLAIVLGVLATVNLFSLAFLSRSTLERQRQTLLDHARVVAGVSVRYMAKGHDYLESIAQDYGAEVGARVLIVDQTGRVLRDSFYEPGVVGAKLTGRPEVDAALAGRESTRTANLPETSRTLYAAAPIQNRDGVMGAVLMAQSLEPALAELAPVRQVLLLVSAAALVLALGAAWGLAASLTRPLSALTRAVRGVAAGDLSQRVPVQGQDEVGRLAAAFNEMAARLTRVEASRRAFVAHAAHELRTPLAALKSLVEPLLSGAVTRPEEQAEFLEELGRQVDRLGVLAGDLLTLSELEARRPLQRQPVDLSELVQTVCSRLQPLARERDVRLELAAPPALTVQVDERKLSRALANLVHNGIQYNRPGGAVTVTVAPHSHGVRIAVADQGPGIPPEDLPHIFAPFYRAERSRSRDRGGAGLGLAIAREIVAAHGGTISVESQLGEGSQFVVDLPQ